MFSPFAKFFTLTTLLCGLAVANASAQGRGPKAQRATRIPVLSSDKPNYGPGTMAVLSGSGFYRGETVALRVASLDGDPSGELGFWVVTANDDGAFVTGWQVCEDECADEELLVTAAGTSSGGHAQTSFSSNNDCGTGVVTSVTPVGGFCSAFTPAVGNGPDNYEVQQGGTYVMTIDGVTECTGDTITVFVQSSESGNFCFNATGGSGTYAGTFTVPNPACNTMPVSYKCGANATCSHPGSLGTQGPNSGCGGVHLRASNFDGNCVKTSTDTECSNPTPMGSCCLPDGTCVEVSQANCVAQGGTYNGDGTLCINQTCPQPTGACCLEDGSCTQLTEEDCVAQNGMFNGDSSLCMDVSCPQPPGACCLVDGSCVEVTDEDCVAMGGTFHGDGTLCVDQTCPQPAGACCLENGTCVQVTAEDCTAQGGMFNGDYTLCKNVTCPQPPGACCLVDGSCVEVTEEDCVAMGGTFRGDDTLCIDQTCPPPPGACCLADGSCVQVSEEDCTAMGGMFNGHFSLCENVTCPPPQGACCLMDGSCVQLSEEECDAIPGLYNGDDTLCAGVMCQQPIVCFVLNFNTDDDGNPMAHGAKVDAEFDCNGLDYPLAITGVVNFSGLNTAAILNSSTGPASQDPDLLVNKGNILILQTDANLSQCPVANSGVYCSHNDDENGGTLSFAFCAPIIPSSIVLVDIDGGDAASSVVLTDVNGKIRTYTVPGNWTGDKVTNFPAPGFGLLDLTTMAGQIGFGSTATASEQAGYDSTAVVQLVVTLGGSGGVDDLSWCQ